MAREGRLKSWAPCINGQTTQLGARGPSVSLTVHLSQFWVSLGLWVFICKGEIWTLHLQHPPLPFLWVPNKEMASSVLLTGHHCAVNEQS